MGRWLNQLRKNMNTAEGGTNKTDKTPGRQVSSVLSVRPISVFEKFAPDEKAAPGGSVSFVSSSPEAFPIFQHPDRTGWDEEDWQVAFEERAAILEYDEGLSRPDAARLARQQIDQQRRTKWH